MNKIRWRERKKTKIRKEVEDGIHSRKLDKEMNMRNKERERETENERERARERREREREREREGESAWVRTSNDKTLSTI
jgi:hypothetical protein